MLMATLFAYIMFHLCSELQDQLLRKETEGKTNSHLSACIVRDTLENWNKHAGWLWFCTQRSVGRGENEKKKNANKKTKPNIKTPPPKPKPNPLNFPACQTYGWMALWGSRQRKGMSTLTPSHWYKVRSKAYLHWLVFPPLTGMDGVIDQFGTHMPPNPFHTVQNTAPLDKYYRSVFQS